MRKFLALVWGVSVRKAQIQETIHSLIRLFLSVLWFPASVSYEASHVLREDTIMSIRSLVSSSRQYRSFLPLIALQCAALGAILLAEGCGSSLELTSEWTSRDVSIDGVSADWPDMQTRIAGPDVRIGIKHDKDNLYVCLTSPSRSTQFQMLALGTTVWFDADGKKNKTFGIQFPVQGLLQGRRFTPPANPDEAKRVMESLVAAAQRQFEIIGPGTGERKKFADRLARGIDVHLGYDDGTLTYELKMPLRRTAENPYGATPDPEKPLGIGFETGDFAALMGSQPGASSRPSGGGGGGRGGRGGGGGGSAIGGGDSPEALRHWLTVHLPGSPAGTPGKR